MQMTAREYQVIQNTATEYLEIKDGNRKIGGKITYSLVFVLLKIAITKILSNL